MKCKADVVSGYVSRFEAQFLWKIFSFPNLPLQSVALFPCSYSILLPITLTPNLRSERTKVRTLLRFTSTITNLHTKLHVYPLLQILVTHFSANRLPRTRTISSAARKRTIHLVCGSCKRKLEHVQTCLSTRVCLTQHPSDTLRLFREFNCRTSYKTLWKIMRQMDIPRCRPIYLR
jgi:hypothetical protein